MNWTRLESIEQLKEITEESHHHPVLIFKHSTRCATSQVTLGRLERSWTDGTPARAYFLDLLQHRDISNLLEQMSGVVHESPQLIILHHGTAVFHRSHFAIEWQVVSKFLEEEGIRN